MRCVIVAGEGGHFCAGGDIAEYPDFRFDEAALRGFHEDDVWGGLGAMLACDLPMLAQIEGNCMGAGVEIASCCDIRVASSGARFGAPIAKLGFPMAPREAALVAREAGAATAREMLLEAAVFDATEMKARGFLNTVLPDGTLTSAVLARAQRIAALSPQAARLNKQALRATQGAHAARGRWRLPLRRQRRTPRRHRGFLAKRRRGFLIFLSHHFADQNMDNSNLFAALRAAFPQDLDRVAIETDDGLNYSWRDLDRASAMVANLLDSLALPPASRVAVQVEKSVEALVLYLATLRAGHVFLPLNTAYQSAEIEYFIGNAEPAVVVCSPGQFGWVSKIAFTAGTRHVFTLGDDRTGSLLERAAHMSDRHTPAVRRGRRPRRHPLHQRHHRPQQGRHAHARQPAQQRRGAQDLLGLAARRRADPRIAHLPRARPVRGHPRRADQRQQDVLDVEVRPQAGDRASSRRPRCSWACPRSTPACWPSPALTVQQAAHMRLFISGSAPLLIETFNDWKARTGHTILERYGMSETAMLTSNPCSADARHGGATERRGGTVGFPLPGVELRVMGDDGQLVQPGEIGGIQVRGPNIFKGYWRMPEKTAEEFTADGFFKTGDVGRIDERGYVNIVGRSKDLIISGGYNVYPAEIEGYINEMPGVVESAVIGVPHPDFGEVGVALLIAKPGAQVDAAQVLASLKSRLANFKIPKRCFVVS